MADTALTVVKSEPLPTLTVTDASPTFWDTHPKTKQAVRGTLDTLPVVGAMVGGALATPETLGTGTVAGAALGAGVGRGGRDLIAEYLGVDSPTSPLSKGARIALDTAITAVVPAVTARTKAILAAPKSSLADVIETIAHPKDTLDAFVDYLRTSGAKKIIPMAPPQEVESVIERYAPNISSAVADPAKDFQAAQRLIQGGMAPSIAVKQIAGTDPKRFANVMTMLMKQNAAGMK